MRESKDISVNKNKPVLNIFQLMDQIVRQLNMSKTIFLIMIIFIIILVSGTLIFTFALLGANSF
jgi:hypothetical protein